MRSQRERMALFAVALSVGLTAAACATTQSTRAAALSARATEPRALGAYDVATVTAFAIPPGGKVDPGVGERLATDIAARLQKDFGELFADVRTAEPIGDEKEIVVSGVIKTYRSGSRAARFMLVGLGSAKLEGELIVKRASDGRVLLSAPFSKLWAWGGVMGASKDIADMLAEAASAAASTIAQAKGWQPAPRERASREKQD